MEPPNQPRRPVLVVSRDEAISVTGAIWPIATYIPVGPMR